MKYWIASTALIASLLYAAPALANSPIGVWKTVDDKTKKTRSHVKIFKGKNGKLYGKIIKLFQQPNEPKNPVCDKCSDYRKNKQIIGMTIIDGLSLDDDVWEGGKILDPGNGKTYRCKLWVQDGGKKIKLRGYIAFFYRTQYWYRLK